MKKLVIKTAIITLISIIGVVAIVMGVLMMFAPKAIAGVFDGLGMENAAFTFYEKQYDKSEDILDLAILVDKVDEKESPLKAEEYCLALIKHEGLNEYLSEHAVEYFGSKTKAREFYYSKLVMAQMNLGKFDDAISNCNKFYSTTGGTYSEGNPFRTILYEKGESLSEAQLKKLRLEIRTKSDNSHEALRTQDLAEIEKILKEKGE